MENRYEVSDLFDELCDQVEKKYHGELRIIADKNWQDIWTVEIQEVADEDDEDYWGNEWDDGWFTVTRKNFNNLTEASDWIKEYYL